MKTFFQEFCPKNNYFHSAVHVFHEYGADDEFWPLFEDVVDVQEIRKTSGNMLLRTDILSEFLPYSCIPDLVKEKKMNVNDLAEAVHDEFPGIFHIDLLTKWLEEGSQHT